ncbi:hypothetical protein NUW54_g3898 [Trametes sanguinea]|uniref:Uncharacterized protein n=1 Tax=Trametes sanguinea TaxID=158606 RepID=A0ACC1Q291_9APHY|nr:hypothetical protein NUW54_g3898 [Trametes sanguinea]
MVVHHLRSLGGKDSAGEFGKGSFQSRWCGQTYQKRLCLYEDGSIHRLHKLYSSTSLNLLNKQHHEQACRRRVLRRDLQPDWYSRTDVKPSVVQVDEADYYDQYYASLAASAAPSAHPTPRMSELGEEEEDVKPSVEYLDSLNEYRKRSRSQDDVGTGGSTPKIPRFDGHLDHTATEAPAYTNGIDVEPPPPTNGTTEDDDPIVYVNGEPVPLSQVTEEHQEAMTPEEYTAYYEILSARS